MNRHSHAWRPVGLTGALACWLVEGCACGARRWTSAKRRIVVEARSGRLRIVGPSRGEG